MNNKRIVILVLFLIVISIGFGILYKRNFIEPFSECSEENETTCKTFDNCVFSQSLWKCHNKSEICRELHTKNDCSEKLGYLHKDKQSPLDYCTWDEEASECIQKTTLATEATVPSSSSTTVPSSSSTTIPSSSSTTIPSSSSTTIPSSSSTEAIVNIRQVLSNTDFELTDKLKDLNDAFDLFIEKNYPY
jgi:hypothetical protein